MHRAGIYTFAILMAGREPPAMANLFDASH